MKKIIIPIVCIILTYAVIALGKFDLQPAGLVIILAFALGIGAAINKLVFRVKK